MKSMDEMDYYTGERKGFFENLRSHIIDFIQTVVVFGAIFALIYLFVAQPHKVSGNSMVPTFRSGDYILTDKLSYRFGLPKRGDVIVLKNPRDETQDFIKRIIAVPGETIRIKENLVYINGQIIKEPYLPPGTLTPGGAFLKEEDGVKAGPNQYFVFGDNRDHSSDSRAWGGVTKEEIVGKVFFRYWPPPAFGLFRPLP